MPGYGLPYKGSKRKIAGELIREMKRHQPGAKYFFDLFGGGGAVSFAALEAGYTVFYNEYDARLAGFMQWLVDRIRSGERGAFGMLPDEYYKFVSRAEFKKQKELNTPYAEFCRLVYSFGNNRRGYLFNPELEKIKGLAHDVVVYQDKKACAAFNKLTGLELKISTAPTVEQRRASYGIQTRKAARNLRELQELEAMGRVQELEQLERVEHLERLERLEHLERLSVSALPYEKVKIPFDKKDVIVYCDPPYAGTDGYSSAFDSVAFFEWVQKNPFRVFVSEYSAPLFELRGVKHISRLCATAKNKVVEKLFCNSGVK